MRAGGADNKRGFMFPDFSSIVLGTKPSRGDGNLPCDPYPGIILGLDYIEYWIHRVRISPTAAPGGDLTNL